LRDRNRRRQAIGPGTDDHCIVLSGFRHESELRAQMTSQRYRRQAV